MNLILDMSFSDETATGHQVVNTNTPNIHVFASDKIDTLKFAPRSPPASKYINIEESLGKKSELQARMISVWEFLFCLLSCRSLLFSYHQHESAWPLKLAVIGSSPGNETFFLDNIIKDNSGDTEKCNQAMLHCWLQWGR